VTQKSCATTPATLLNQQCQCITLDEQQLNEALQRETRSLGLSELGDSHPHLFSRSAFFVDSETISAMRGVVAAVERVVTLPGYRERALADAHPHARHEPKTKGVFLGYDFHLSEAGPQLIEINTNAGGGLLNAFLRAAQRACCEPVAEAFGVGADQALSRFSSMFRQEWRLARGDAPLARIAIVDDRPQSQYLYPEFLLFIRLMESQGLEALLCDAAELEVRDGRLWARNVAIDLVYNRTTDFSLSEPAHVALLEAYLHDLAVITPHPRAHALYADKRRLALLSDPTALAGLGAEAADCELLAQRIPLTRIVDPEQRESLWRDRRHLFFKPQSGYGSKAAYRGDKLTKAVFEQILRQPYVAQALVPPSARRVRQGDELLELKADVRNFAYAGQVQLVCARLYQGQTTNFRTPGGGFAPVYETTFMEQAGAPEANRSS
jgi:hypothetical protein